MSRIWRQLGSITYILPVIFLFILSCKTKHADSEPSFEIRFVKSDIWKIKTYCFKAIYGKDHQSFADNCIDTLHSTIDFPIDIHQDSSVFIFEQAKRRDTLEVKYSVKIGLGGYEFEPVIQNFQISKCTFDSIRVEQNANSPDQIQTFTVYL